MIYSRLIRRTRLGQPNGPGPRNPRGERGGGGAEPLSHSQQVQCPPPPPWIQLLPACRTSSCLLFLFCPSIVSLYCRQRDTRITQLQLQYLHFSFSDSPCAAVSLIGVRGDATRTS
ncbi:hypothetical protein P167DRAFT_392129 [Morchella conica CCBAS932]|uniref:Uncharacterized protein n=1 Tax=Morchella conica CCBAS932 TaxID=1392247 RepID=A0A3N4KH75_9PEZI|nr:hypothetical protein P167DRAFT_392129 [Morchella conica CCBAS932]